MTIMVMDGQGGRMGKSVVEQIRKRFPEDEILAIGTNSIATAAMLKAGGGRPEPQERTRPLWGAGGRISSSGPWASSSPIP